MEKKEKGKRHRDRCRWRVGMKGKRNEGKQIDNLGEGIRKIKRNENIIVTYKKLTGIERDREIDRER